MNKIIVKIGNQEYTIIGDEEKDYILSLASHVDEQIAQASEKAPKVNNVTPVVLASINIADQYFKEAEKNKVLKDQLKDGKYTDDDWYEEKIQLIEEQDKKIEELLNKIQELEDSFRDKNIQLNELKVESVEKSQEVEKLHGVINEFQNHIYELQLKLNK